MKIKQMSFLKITIENEIICRENHTGVLVKDLHNLFKLIKLDKVYQL